MSFSRRRTQFAMPFVVVTACTDAPPVHHARHPKPPVACVIPALPAPSATRPPELVDQLPPLADGSTETQRHPHWDGLAIHLIKRIPGGDGSITSRA